MVWVLPSELRRRAPWVALLCVAGVAALAPASASGGRTGTAGGLRGHLRAPRLRQRRDDRSHRSRRGPRRRKDDLPRRLGRSRQGMVYERGSVGVAGRRRRRDGNQREHAARRREGGNHRPRRRARNTASRGSRRTGPRCLGPRNSRRSSPARPLRSRSWASRPAPGRRCSRAKWRPRASRRNTKSLTRKPRRNGAPRAASHGVPAGRSVRAQLPDGSGFDPVTVALQGISDGREYCGILTATQRRRRAPRRSTPKPSR